MADISNLMMASCTLMDAEPREERKVRVLDGDVRSWVAVTIGYAAYYKLRKMYQEGVPTYSAHFNKSTNRGRVKFEHPDVGVVELVVDETEYRVWAKHRHFLKEITGVYDEPSVMSFDVAVEELGLVEGSDPEIDFSEWEDTTTVNWPTLCSAEATRNLRNHS